MFLERLELTDFRNYVAFDRVFERNRVILLGDNAQGKTNLLEAIGALATAASPFAAREADLVRWGQAQAIVRSVVRKEAGQVGVDLLFRPAGRRAVKVNGLHQKRIADLLGTVSAVVFSREDLELVSGAPALRRGYLDWLLLQLQPVYHEELQRYARVLAQRNHALRAISDGRSAISALDLWDPALAGTGASLHRRRGAAIEALAPLARGWHARIAGSEEDLAIAYGPGVAGPDWEEALRAALADSRAREIGRGQTLVGPHRDDLAIALDGREAKAFSSTGQKRTIALALKLAELDLLRRTTGEAPILLLDDVLAELDVTRQNRLLEAIGTDTQTFVTSTHLSDFSADWIAQAEIYEVRAGRIDRAEVG
ncbi:MAG: DNA replication/repair protein RecF [Candidatus Sericytochromatia bacterium]|nr:DNA replication/repair protein RecF [Candidatus Tanganyikabacteria bacterium]